MYENSLFIFRRDLRLRDNSGLIKALESSKQVAPCFIFDPCQVEKTNKYRSLNAIQFMIKSIQELNDDLEELNSRLFIFYGKPCEVLLDIIKTHKFQAVFVNKDYTPFSIQRDKDLKNVCDNFNIPLIDLDDTLLNNPNSILNKQNKPYTKFTAFFKTASILTPQKPKDNAYKNYYVLELKSKYLLTIKDILRSEWAQFHNQSLFMKGGRKESLNILKSLKKFKNYNATRDYPSKPTTGLSPHIKFGTISIREVYHAIVKKIGFENGLIRQLYWHDFFTYIAYHFPHVFGSSFHKRYNAIKWSYNKSGLEKWCSGKTGFPFIDAGMRQLKVSGYMHNRARLVVASFLTKDLHINWAHGEKYFAQNLVDYDPAINNGNWQWTASTGCDSQPYFRVFNPWIQQKKFDPQCEYIKRWIPELKNVPNNIIHNWYKSNITTIGYPKPMVDHLLEAQKAKKIWKRYQRHI